ncbi:hypothetical protein GF342_03440 [Candidatus Woesearchaeota archaeon]|nr:hypothetical protein [Candidatus Woesearchaeota archaeon]
MTLQRVTLYKHGVGFFERKFSMSGEGKITLFFEPEQMNDVLKSVSAVDTSDGYVANISYDTARPQPSKFSLENGAVLQTLILQLIGVTVKAKIGQKTMQGAIVGLENRQTATEQTSVMMPHLVISTDQSVQQVPLQDVEHITIQDKQIAEELQRYLDAFLSKQKEGKKELSIHCKGKGKRDIHVSYLTSAPVWKTSYRVVLDKKPLLQGWGMIDNTTHEDWKEVRVSLIAGQPISFVYGLYAPHYASRPHIGVQTTEAMAPTTLESAEEEYEDMSMAPMASSMGAPAMKKEMARSKVAALSKPQAAPTSVKTTSITQEVGALFEYEIEKPVSVRKNESASLPLFSKNVKGNKALVYNESTRPLHPMNTIDMTNSTGLTLEGGPLFVIDEGTYVGEALLPALQTDEQRFVPYGVELGVDVKKEIRSTTLPIYFVKIVKGIMYQYYISIRETQYKINNKTKRAHTLHVEHPRDRSYTVEQPKTFKETDNFLRFTVDLKAQKPETFTVKEQKTSTSTSYLSDITENDLKFYLEKKYISKALEKQIQEVMNMKRTIAELSRKKQELQKLINELKTDQARIRENMKALGRSSQEEQVRQRYLTKLAEQENDIEDSTEAIKNNEEKVKQLQEDLTKKLEKINFEVRL